MPFSDVVGDGYDVAIVGTGFAATFFLTGYLKNASPDARVLVLERGKRWDHATQLENRRITPVDYDDLQNRTGEPGKVWMFTIGFGGGSNCWWGNAPRFLAADFEMKSRFGVGRDWPIGYSDLEPYYEQVEETMLLAGPSAPFPFPRRTGYAQPPHRFSRPEEQLKTAYPDSFFATPCARTRIVGNGRGACCGNGVCSLCPVNAKWSVETAYREIYDDPRVTVVLEAEALGVETAAGQARGVRYRRGGREAVANADLVVLAANSVFNPVLLQRSGLDHPLLGKRLHEQVGLKAEVFLDGMEGLQGSTSVSGHAYHYYFDEDRRRQMAACMVETWNVGLLRTEPGRWTQVLPVRMVYEVLPEERNFARFDPANPDRPELHYEGHDAYTQRAIDRAAADLEQLMKPLPVEKIVVHYRPEATEAHILGTTVMGNDPADSIVDAGCRHHEVRNLLVLGGSTFPVSGPSNPSLTISALALRAGQMLEA